MKPIIEKTFNEYKIINIRKNTPILEYLRKNYYSFRLQQVDCATFELLKNKDKKINIEYGNFIADYVQLENEIFEWNGELRVSDPNNMIIGSFIIEDKQIIYDARNSLYEQRKLISDFAGAIIYTNMSMTDILKEEINLKRKRKYLIYIGEQLNIRRCGFENVYEEVSKEELIEYATNSEKGKAAYVKTRSY